MIEPVTAFIVVSFVWPAICWLISGAVARHVPPTAAPTFAIAVLLIALAPPLAVALPAAPRPPGVIADFLSGMSIPPGPPVIAETMGDSPARAQIDWAYMLAAIYVTGAAAMLLRLFLGAARLRRLVAAAAAAEHPSHGAFLTVDGAATAFSYGFSSSRIIVPRAYLEQFTELQIAQILAHEKAHIARRDPFAFAALSLIDAVWWHSPFVHRLTDRCRLAAELACDARVLQAYPGAEKNYAETMLRCLRQLSGAPTGHAPAITNRSRIRDYQMRLTSILTPRNTTSKRAAVTIALLALCAAPTALASHWIVAPATLVAAAAPSGEIAAELERAHELFSNGDETAAREVFDALLERNDLDASERAKALQGRAATKANAGDYEGADEDFAAAIATGALTEERADEIDYYRAQSKLARGEYQGAIDGFEDYIAKRPDDAQVRYLKAVAHFALGEIDEARQNVEKALAIDPAHEEAKKLKAEIEKA